MRWWCDHFVFQSEDLPSFHYLPAYANQNQTTYLLMMRLVDWMNKKVCRPHFLGRLPESGRMQSIVFVCIVGFLIVLCFAQTKFILWCDRGGWQTTTCYITADGVDFTRISWRVLFEVKWVTWDGVSDDKKVFLGYHILYSIMSRLRFESRWELFPLNYTDRVGAR